MEEHEAFVKEQIKLLNAPMDVEALFSDDPKAPRIPPELLAAVQTTVLTEHAKTRKAKLGPVGQLYKQLESLALEQGALQSKQHQQIKQENALTLDVHANWLDQLPDQWPNRSNPKKARALESKIAQAKQTQRRCIYMQQQKAHYQKILTALQAISVAAVKRNLPVPGSSLDAKMTELVQGIEQQRREGQDSD